ncbi:440_t:CDS:2, partial [Racocetra persica]
IETDVEIGVKMDIEIDIEDNIKMTQSEENNNEINNNAGFPLAKGWVLKENQKLGNRGGNRIKKNVKAILKHFFLNENQKSADRINAKNMHKELLKYAENGDIKKENIPEIITIDN